MAKLPWESINANQRIGTTDTDESVTCDFRDTSFISSASQGSYLYRKKASSVRLILSYHNKTRVDQASDSAPNV